MTKIERLASGSPYPKGDQTMKTAAKTAFLITLPLSFLLTACAPKTLEFEEENSAFASYDISDTLIAVDPEFAKLNQGAALSAHYNADTSFPLRTQPKSAELVIAPHITKDGVYHNYSAAWIVIEEGDWAVVGNTSQSSKRGSLVVTPLKKDR